LAQTPQFSLSKDKCPRRSGGAAASLKIALEPLDEELIWNLRQMKGERAIAQRMEPLELFLSLS